MSFLSGIVNFGKSALGFLGGNSIASSLVKTALLGLAVNKMSQSAIKENNSGTKNIDEGVRLQLTPNAEAKIPVLYGDAYFGGNLHDAAMTNANKTMWYSLVLSEKTGTRYSGGATTYTFHDVYWNEQRIVFRADGITADYTVDTAGTIDRSISGLVKVYLYAGSATSGQVPSGYSGSVPSAYSIFPNWASGTHPMTNLVFAIVQVDYNKESNVTGLGNMLFQVESNMKTPGDVLYDYLTSSVYGCGIPSAEIDTTAIGALNTYSLTSVSYNDEGSGAQTLPNRYQINGLIDTDENVLKNAEQICSAAASWLSYDTHTGKWSVVINKADNSIATFDDTNILGNISVGGTGIQDLYNSVKVEFPHRDLRDSADFVKIEIPSGDRNANEPDNSLNITYDIINEQVQAELLGFIELKQSRVDLVIQFETDFTYINLKAGDVISVNDSLYSFSNQPFRIITITERQDNDGALIMQITALEYDADVYSVQDITRYTRSDDTGIIGIGSIGAPNAPQVTKYERAARPRIEIETQSPSGVVEGLEYWITFDDEQPDDTLRSYSLIGTKKPLGGGIFTSGTNVVFEYDNIGATNFYVKVRGFNTTTVGQFSNPSGLVEFIPEQVPDAITPDTAILDETGGLATLLGIVSLLNNLDGLFGGDANTSLFDKIFQTFETLTGTDIISTAQDGIISGADVDTAVADYFTANPPTGGSSGESCSIYLETTLLDLNSIRTALPGELGGDTTLCDAPNFWTDPTSAGSYMQTTSSPATQYLKVDGNYELKIIGRGFGSMSVRFIAGIPYPTTIYGNRNYFSSVPFRKINNSTVSATLPRVGLFEKTGPGYTISYNNSNPANTTTITYTSTNASASNYSTHLGPDKYLRVQDYNDVNKYATFKITNSVFSQSGTYPNITYVRTATVQHLYGTMTTWPSIVRSETASSLNNPLPASVQADFTAGEYLGCVGTKDQINAFLNTFGSMQHQDLINADGTLKPTNTADFIVSFIFKDTATNTVVATNNVNWKYITPETYNNPSGQSL